MPDIPSGTRAQHWLERLMHRATAADMYREAASDALGLRDALRATGAEPLPDAGTASDVPGARLHGRESGPPWPLCTLCPDPPTADERGVAPWRPNAHGSGTAVLLAVLEALAAGPPQALPAEDVLCLLFPVSRSATPAPGADAPPAVQAWAARELLPLRGVLAGWQVAGAGLTLDLDVRSLGSPAARALTDELFTLGRALGYDPFARGIQTAFPGPHVPFLERGLPAVPLCGHTDLLAGSAEDRLDTCDATSLHAVSDTLVRFLRGERVV